MKILITGICGFLGSHIADAWISNDAEVIGCDNLSTGDLENAPANASVYTLDCRDNHTLMQIMNGCDVVYHCAALAHEGLSVFSPYLITDNILGGSASVFSAAIQAGVPRIVHMSSMSRYGIGDPPFKESDEPRPVDPYAIAKVASEDVLRAMAEAHGIEYVIAVPHSIIGVRQSFVDPFRNVASIFINRMLQGKPPIIYGDGSQVRCFSPVCDIIPGLVRMGEDETLNGEIINVGPDKGDMTILHLAQIIADLTGFKGDPTFLPGRSLEVHHATCSAEKSRALLDYEAKTSVQDTLAEMVEDVRRKGPRPFRYSMPIEICTEDTPRTWLERTM